MKHLMQILVLLSIFALCFGEVRSDYYNQLRNQEYQNQNQEYQNRNQEYQQRNQEYQNRNQYNRYAERLEYADYTYEIREGDCKGTKLVDEVVSKDAQEFTVKKTTYTWMGRNMYHVTCVKVFNRMPNDSKAGQARITDGGVGEGKVRIEMISKNSQGLRFQVEIWGEPTREQEGNIAVLTNTPDKVLYMGGKKYCECR